ncbi:transposase [Micromonospora sp. STR1s_5]|nr:transposase [Micromonospora sp. STR1s_5]
MSWFADRDRFASWSGSAPLNASLGDQKRHRLSRAGDRRISRTSHIMARGPAAQPRARPRLLRREEIRRRDLQAMRALERRLSNVVYARMIEDQKRRQAAGP